MNLLLPLVNHLLFTVFILPILQGRKFRIQKCVLRIRLKGSLLPLKTYVNCKWKNILTAGKVNKCGPLSKLEERKIEGKTFVPLRNLRYPISHANETLPSSISYHLNHTANSILFYNNILSLLRNITKLHNTTEIERVYPNGYIPVCLVSTEDYFRRLIYTH